MHCGCRRVSWWGAGPKLQLRERHGTGGEHQIGTGGNFGFLGTPFPCEPPSPPASALWSWATAGGPALEVASGAQSIGPGFPAGSTTAWG